MGEDVNNPHLPEIFAYDSIPWDFDVPVKWGYQPGEDHTVFWYRKEIVEPLPYKYPRDDLDIESTGLGGPADPWWTHTQSPEEEELKQLVRDAVYSLRRNSVAPKDQWNLANWGYRPEDDLLVYIDLSCRIEPPRKRFLGLF